jgi:hypothetical protein
VHSAEELMELNLFDSIDKILFKSKPESDEFMICIRIVLVVSMHDSAILVINKDGNIPKVILKAFEGNLGKHPNGSIMM